MIQDSLSDLQFTVNRLVAGEIHIICPDNSFFVIRPASPELRQRAYLFASKQIEKLKYNHVFNESILIRKAMRAGILPKDYKQALKKTQEEIDATKIAMYRAYPKKDTIAKFKKTLDMLKKSIGLQNKYIDKIKQHSLEGLHRSIESNYIFLNSIYQEDAKCEDLSQRTLNHITYQFSRDLLSDTDIRYVARSNSWRSLWSAGKYSIFSNSLAALTEEQRALAHFSELYDFAYGNEKCPAEEIIENDDLFDGWYLVQIEKFKEKKSDKDAESLASHIDPKFQEVFMVANSQEEADGIYSANSKQSQKILRERARTMKKVTNVRDAQFPDVQRDLRIQANEQFKTRGKGK